MAIQRRLRAAAFRLAVMVAVLAVLAQGGVDIDTTTTTATTTAAPSLGGPDMEKAGALKPSPACQRPVQMTHGIVCACSAECPDTVEPLGEIGPDDVVVYQTSKAGGRLDRSTLKFEQKDNGGWQHITLDPSQTFQEIIGFGGAFTDAAADNLYSLTPPARDHLLAQYYGPGGAQYTLGRIPMASCDFSTRSYSYDDVEGDFDLDHFSIDMDKDQKLPMIKRALDLAATTPGTQAGPGSDPLTLFASPWSAPKWMKDSGSVVGGQLSGAPGGRHHKAWALYFSRFLTAYKKEGVNVNMVTIENEPQGAPTWAGPAKPKWETMFFNSTHEGGFLKEDLGPLLRRNHPEVKIIIHDDQRAYLPGRVQPILDDPEAAAYVDGVGVHWYTGVEDLFNEFGKLTSTHEKWPSKFILPTEACEGYIPVVAQGPRAGSWHRGQTYGYDIMGDLNAWSAGWTDWNIALDMSGGPSWAKNNVDAPVLVDGSKNEFYKQPMYYYMAHFSRFLVRGSKRIGFTSTGPLGTALETTAFVTPDGNVVVVVMNRLFLAKTFHIKHSKGFINTSIPAESIQTFVFKL